MFGYHVIVQLDAWDISGRNLRDLKSILTLLSVSSRSDTATSGTTKAAKAAQPHIRGIPAFKLAVCLRFLFWLFVHSTMTGSL